MTTKKYFFKVNEDLVSRATATKLGLNESKSGIWYIDSPKNAHQRRNLQSIFNHFQCVQLQETTSGSVATVTTNLSKPASQVGSLFGGTYKQKKIKKTNETRTKFAGELVGQIPGDQVRGSEKVKTFTKEHPFKGRLVGGM